MHKTTGQTVAKKQSLRDKKQSLRDRLRAATSHSKKGPARWDAKLKKADPSGYAQLVEICREWKSGVYPNLPNATDLRAELLEAKAMPHVSESTFARFIKELEI